jgi:hypothetical protein
MGWFRKLINFFVGTTPIGASIKAVSTINDIITTTKDGLDVLSATPQQKEKTIEQTMKAVNDFQVKVAGESTSRSRTRRQIALAFVIVYLTLIIGGVLVWRLDPAYSQHIFNVVASLNSIVMTIMISYFGYYAACNVIKTVKANKE